MNDDPGKLGGRLLDFALSILLAAMAIWGAVALVSAIWKPLCITVAICALVGWLVWWLLQRLRRW